MARKLSGRERGLLTGLFWVALVTTTAAALVLITQEIADQRQLRRALDAELADLVGVAAQPDSAALALQITELEAALATERSRFFREEDTDLYQLGLQMRNELDALALEVVRYQPIESERTRFVEFSVRGDARQLMRFLRQLSLATPERPVAYLSLQQRSAGELAAVIRVRYETIRPVD